MGAKKEAPGISFANTKTFFCWNGREKNPEAELGEFWGLQMQPAETL